MKTIANYKRCKMKWNNKNHKKDRKNKHENCQSSKTDNVQQDENVRTQDHARNELIMITQLDWLQESEFSVLSWFCSESESEWDEIFF